MYRRSRMRSVLPAGAALRAAGALAVACSSGGSAPASPGGGAQVTIKAVLPPNTGPITAADNLGLQKLTQQYEAPPATRPPPTGCCPSRRSPPGGT
jgi:hypothetical protein